MKICDRVGNAIRTCESFINQSISERITDVYDDSTVVVMVMGKLHGNTCMTCDIFINGEVEWSGIASVGVSLFHQRIPKAQRDGRSWDSIVNKLVELDPYGNKMV